MPLRPLRRLAAATRRGSCDKEKRNQARGRKQELGFTRRWIVAAPFICFDTLCASYLLACHRSLSVRGFIINFHQAFTKILHYICTYIHHYNTKSTSSTYLPSPCFVPLLIPHPSLPPPPQEQDTTSQSTSSQSPPQPRQSNPLPSKSPTTNGDHPQTATPVAGAMGGHLRLPRGGGTSGGQGRGRRRRRWVLSGRCLLFWFWGVGCVCICEWMCEEERRRGR